MRHNVANKTILLYHWGGSLIELLSVDIEAFFVDIILSTIVDISGDVNLITLNKRMVFKRNDSKTDFCHY